MSSLEIYSPVPPPDITVQELDAELFTLSNDSRLERPQKWALSCVADGGGADVLIPVARALLPHMGMVALAGGVGREKITDPGRSGLLATPIDFPYKPDLLIMTPTSDGRYEEFLYRAFPETPALLLEDYPDASNKALKRISQFSSELPTVGVIDTEAVSRIEYRFPDLDVPMVVTGSPALDALAHEQNVQKLKASDIGMYDEELVMIALPPLGHTQLAEQIAEVCSQLKGNYAFAVRPHPNDTVDQAMFDKVFNGLKTVDTSAYSSEQVATIARLVIAQRSTLNHKAAILQVPNISVRSHLRPGYTLPAAATGVSLAAKPDDLLETASQLLDTDSEQYKSLQASMAAYVTRFVDGLSTQRVLNVAHHLMSDQRSKSQ